jgi:hypothetical protein
MDKFYKDVVEAVERTMERRNQVRVQDLDYGHRIERDFTKRVTATVIESKPGDFKARQVDNCENMKRPVRKKYYF